MMGRIGVDVQYGLNPGHHARSVGDEQDAPAASRTISLVVGGQPGMAQILRTNEDLAAIHHDELGMEVGVAIIYIAVTIVDHEQDLCTGRVQLTRDPLFLICHPHECRSPLQEQRDADARAQPVEEHLRQLLAAEGVALDPDALPGAGQQPMDD